MGKVKKQKAFNIERDGLRPEWSRFIDEYMVNGSNGTLAYQKVFPKSGYNSARAHGARLVAKGSVKAEIRYRLDQERITDGWVYSNTKQYAEKGLDNAKYAMAGVKAVEMAGKMRGMLVDTKKFVFDDKNPANVPPVVPAEKAKQLDGIIKGGGVIE